MATLQPRVFFVSDLIIRYPPFLFFRAPLSAVAIYFSQEPRYFVYVSTVKNYFRNLVDLWKQ